MFFAPGDKVSRGLAGVIVKRLYLFSWGVRDLLALRKDGGDYGRCPLDLQKREGSALLSHYLTAGFENKFGIQVNSSPSHLIRSPTSLTRG